jgi:formylglycine-generating enzyme required for sulfatase activity
MGIRRPGRARIGRVPVGRRGARSNPGQLGRDESPCARVGSFSANPYGLYDMAGNVWEFVQDSWTDRYWTPPASAAPQDRHVIRGGSYGASPINLRVRYRDSHPAAGAGPHVGFRCARSAIR